MLYPTYLQGHITDLKDKYLSTMTLISTNGNEKLSIYYYGQLEKVKGETGEFIKQKENAPVLIIAKDEETGEEFTVFDGAQCGYANMFHNTYDKTSLENRTFEKLQVPAQKIIAELSYAIDYDDEEDGFEYEYDKDGKILLVDGRTMTLDEVKSNGYDYIALSYMNKKGEIIPFFETELD